VSYDSGKQASFEQALDDVKLLLVEGATQACGLLAVGR
jgi:hypothetical protein